MTNAEIVPQVGMGATVVSYSDRHAGTIVEATPTRVVVQRDTAVRVDNHGMSDAQYYTYERNLNGIVETFSLRKNGTWVMRGMATRDGITLALDCRSEYYDYTF